MRRAATICGAIAVACGLLFACSDRVIDEITGTAGVAEAAAEAAPVSPFVEVAAAAGLDFVHDNGAVGELYYNEHLGAGVALFDYDGDGDLDVYVVQGQGLDRNPSADKRQRPSDQLFRNELTVDEAGSPRLRFVEVTRDAGIEATGYGMGVATGDYDGDGWIDLYVTNWGGPNQLWRNRGDGTFEETTTLAGVGDRRWGVAATFLDFDRDGDLDLYVGNYLDYSLALHKECTNDIGQRDYCGPASFEPVADALYRNLGNGRFEEVLAAVAPGIVPAPVLGAVTGDFDGDGRDDVYLANDEYPNHLLMGREGILSDRALLAGAALNRSGDAEAGMGIAVGDFDRDGDEDLFVAHLDSETNTLYVNQSEPGIGPIFDDGTAESGLGAPSVGFTGFGAGFLDFDNDGYLDIFVANGAVQILREQALAGSPHPLAQRNQLFRNLGGGRFAEIEAPAGSVLALSEVSRGAAFGDLDNDGDTDIVVHNNGGPLRLLENVVGAGASWLGLSVVTGDPPRMALGATVTLETPGGPTVRRVRTASSYASASDPRLLFGLGSLSESERTPLRATVAWPDGTREDYDGLLPGGYTELRQGTGRARAPQER